MKVWKEVVSFLPLALVLGFPSLGIVGRWFGVPLALAYLLLLPVLLWWGHRIFWPRLVARLRGARAHYFVGAAMLALALIFAVIYPIADGAADGGSDRDSALNLAVIALADGRYPYHARTNLGNPISPLPGALLLAAPFVALGNSAYQNFLWLGLLYLAWRRYTDDSHHALRLWLLPLTASPVVLHEFLTGGDFLANSIYIWLFTFAFVAIVSAPKSPRWQRVATALLWGLALASRFNFFTIIPIVLAALWQRAGARRALGYSALGLLTTTTLTLPFYLADPTHFTPLLTANKLAQLSPYLPYAGAVIPLATLLFALLLTTRPLASDRVLNGAIAAVLTFPILLAFLITTAAETTLNTYYPSFALAPLFFALAALSPTSKR